MTRVRVLACTLAVAPLLVLVPVTTPAHGAAVTVAKKTLHFATKVGPNNDKACDVIGDLYTPSTATKAHPAPAILTTHGFGGSKDDGAGIGAEYGAKGYVVLSYSGLGFGGSGCKIELDDRDWDGKAGSQLLDFLGGKTAAKDGTKVDYVKLDNVAHDGKHHAYDPRVGMIGGSYGGQIQFAIAGIDPRLDTIIPIITWNDLAYSLAPNNTSATTGVSYATPGMEKVQWVSLFFGLGIVNGVQGAQVDPTRNVGCPNFDDRACSAKVMMDTTGYPDASTMTLARHASVASFINQIKIPTFLAQGQGDTLFNLQEAVATYRALKSRHVPVKLLFQSWGHSEGGQPGENDGPDSYEHKLFAAWFDHYLRGQPVSTGSEFEYFRAWAYTKPHADRAYAHAKAYPVGTDLPLYMSGTSSLVNTVTSVAGGSASFTTPPPGTAASYSETSEFQGSTPATVGAPRDTPGTFAAFSTPALTRDVDVVGSPSLLLHMNSPTASASQGVGPAGMLVLFAKLYDIAPDGSIVLAHRLISPIRIADVNKPVKVALPAIVHRFAKGHRIQLVVAASDSAYANNRSQQSVSIVTDGKSPSLVRLPVLSVASARVAVQGDKNTSGSGGAGSGSGGSDLASTGLASWWPALALLICACATALAFGRRTIRARS